MVDDDREKSEGRDNERDSFSFDLLDYEILVSHGVVRDRRASDECGKRSSRFNQDE